MRNLITTLLLLISLIASAQFDLTEYTIELKPSLMYDDLNVHGKLDLFLGSYTTDKEFTYGIEATFYSRISDECQVVGTNCNFKSVRNVLRIQDYYRLDGELSNNFHATLQIESLLKSALTDRDDLIFLYGFSYGHEKLRGNLSLGHYVVDGSLREFNIESRLIVSLGAIYKIY